MGCRVEKRLVAGGIVAVKGGSVGCRVEKKLEGKASKLQGRHPSCRLDLQVAGKTSNYSSVELRYAQFSCGIRHAQQVFTFMQTSKLMPLF